MSETDGFDAMMWGMFGDGRRLEPVSSADRLLRQATKTQRHRESIAMQHECPRCGARPGEVCSPLPAYPSSGPFMPTQRVHEMRMDGSRQ